MNHRSIRSLQLPNRTLPLGERTLVMGILNVTPDSFSEQGQFFDRKAAIARGLEMEREGADIVDVGGESTRPGAVPVSEQEELDRVIPVIEALRRKGLIIPISIDTYKSGVAARALAAGAEIVNDVSGLRYDPALAAVVKKFRAAVVLMHLRGTPSTMQHLAPVRNIVSTVRQGLRVSLRRALAAGIHKRKIVLDPGIGFGKTAEQNFELIIHLSRLHLSRFHLSRHARDGYPLLVGPSRKFFIRKTVEGLALSQAEKKGQAGVVPEKILFGTAAAVTAAILNGADIVRVHDVRQMVPVARLADRLIGS